MTLARERCPVDQTVDALVTLVLSGLLLVWSSGGLMGLRQTLLTAFVALLIIDCVRLRTLPQHLSRGILMLLGCLFIQSLLSMVFSVDRPYSVNRWWHDYGVALFLAAGGAHFAPRLRQAPLFCALLVGLALDGTTDLVQVLTIENPAFWSGHFADYFWQNGRLTLVLGVMFGFFERIRRRDDTHWVAVGMIMALGMLAFFSSWARANALALICAGILTMTLLFCFRPWSMPASGRLMQLFGILWLGALLYRLLPSCSGRVPSNYELVLIPLSAPLALLFLPEEWRKKCFWIGVMLGPLAGILVLAHLFHNGLKNTDSEVVRAFSYKQVVTDPAEAPLLGHGPGRDIVMKAKPDWHPQMKMEVCRRLGVPATEEILRTPVHGGHTHIQWINWRYELGWLGLGLILALVGAAFINFIRSMLHGEGDWFMIGMGTAVVAFNLVIPMANFHSSGLAQEHWAFWGVLMGLHAVATRRMGAKEFSSDP